MVHPTYTEYSVDHHYYGSNLPTILNDTYPMLANYYILQGMYSSDETSSSMTDNDDNQSSNPSVTEQDNNQVVAVPSTLQQSLNISYFLNQSTSDVDLSDVIPTETELSTSVTTTSEDRSSTLSLTSEYSSESLPTYRNLLFYFPCKPELP